MDAAANIKTSNKTKEEILQSIMESIETAAKEANIDMNLEVHELEVPVIYGITIITYFRHKIELYKSNTSLSFRQKSTCASLFRSRSPSFRYGQG